MTFELACMTFKFDPSTYMFNIWVWPMNLRYVLHLVRPLNLLVWHLYKQPMNLSVWPLNLHVWRSSGSLCTPDWGWTDCMTSIYATYELICLTSELTCLTFLWKSSYSRLRLSERSRSSSRFCSLSTRFSRYVISRLTCFWSSRLSSVLAGSSSEFPGGFSRVNRSWPIKQPIDKKKNQKIKIK